MSTQYPWTTRHDDLLTDWTVHTPSGSVVAYGLTAEHARLLAAAPDLVRVLRFVAERLSHPQRISSTDRQRWRAKCLAAIALAGGSSPPGEGS